MKKPIQLTCKDNSHVEGDLTLGKAYDLEENPGLTSRFVYVRNDLGAIGQYYKWRFEERKEGDHAQ